MEPTPPPLPPVPSAGTEDRFRWGLHLALLASYPLGLGLISQQQVESDPDAPPALSTDVGELLLGVLLHLGLFLILYLLAVRVSGATAGQLMLRWRGGPLPVLLGLGYSVGLRVAVGLVVMLLAALYMLANPEANRETFEALKPNIDRLVDQEELTTSPLYFWINLTVISFLLAGFREELWRGGMLAALLALVPALQKSVLGKIAASALVAVVFGLGHLPQGPGGVLLTGLLGFFLGLIMVFHRSIWEAVFAHGFFNATSFVMLYLLKAGYLDELLKRLGEELPILR